MHSQAENSVAGVTSESIVSTVSQYIEKYLYFYLYLKIKSTLESNEYSTSSNFLLY